MKKDTLSVLIVDDEPLAREGLRLLLQDEKDIHVVGECANGQQALEVLSLEKVDLVFLDVQMPEMTGIQMLSRLERPTLPAIIFVTAYDHYALDAFKVHALDYLLKPFTDEQFHDALDRARSLIRKDDARDLADQLLALLNHYGLKSDSLTKPGYVARLSIQTGGRMEFVRTDDIDWIEAADYYVELHVGSKTHLLRETMNRLEQRLDPSRFVRIHRSTITNVERIHSIEPFFKGDYCVVLKDGKKLKVSKNRYEKLKSVLIRS